MAQLDNEFMQTILDGEAWKNLSREIAWNEDLLEKCKDKVDWNEISKNYNTLWTTPMLDHFRNYLNWDELSNNIRSEALSPDAIETFEDRWNWHLLSGNQCLNLTDDLLQKYADRLDWQQVIDHRDLFTVNSFNSHAMEFYNRYKDRIPTTGLQDSCLWSAMCEERKQELMMTILK